MNWKLTRLLSAIVLGATLAAGCGGDNSTPTAPSVNVPFSTTTLREGSGAQAAVGNALTVNYTGWLYSTTAADNKGTQFDTSIGKTPFTFILANNQAIPGFLQGVLGMRVGELRRIVIPPNLAYGTQGSPPQIPGNATLIFEVDLLTLVQ